MKPWFNTALILMLTLIWMVIGFQLHKRLSHVELSQNVREVSEMQTISLHEIWHQRMKKND